MVFFHRLFQKECRTVRAPLRSGIWRALAFSLGAAQAILGCREGDPPGPSVHGAELGRDPSLSLKAHVSPAMSNSAEPLPTASSASSAPSSDAEPSQDSMPGQGAKIASIAMRTWIYVAPDDRSTKLGYLRAGAVVERAETSAGSAGCAGGFYRILPRGYVCVGKGASLSLDHPIVQAAVRGPDRKALSPYHYVISRSPPPHLYFKLPKKKDQERAEDISLDPPPPLWPGLSKLPEDPVPEFLLSGNELPKPYGAEKPLHYLVHRGRANDNSAFGLITTFTWTGRRFGLTTELDLIPLDRTKPAILSPLQGVVVPPVPVPPGAVPNEVKSLSDRSGASEGRKKKKTPSKKSADPYEFPVPAIVMQRAVMKFRKDDKGEFREDGALGYRQGLALTGRDNGSPHGLVETLEGFWVPAQALKIPELREDPAGYARDGKKWIDVSIKRQMLVAYEGRRPVFATLVSTGIGELGDPEKTHSTVRGTFLIHSKHVSGTMDGDPVTDNYDLRDVPYIQYFHEGFALHGAYWHDEFGKARSHGCINLAPADAAWMFEWTDPPVPAEWHGAVNAEGGTLVYTHP